jgi:hypothetical protein
VIDVGEDGAEAVKVFRRVRVELVIVALCATDRGAEPRFGDVADAIGVVLGPVLGVLSASLMRRLEKAVIAAGDPLPHGRIRQQIAA